MPSASAPTPATISALPSASGTTASGSRVSRSTRRAGMSASRPIGTFMKNTQRQPTASTSRPPSDGPRAAATAPVALQIATAVARFSTGNSGSSSASEVGTRIAPAAAWRMRAATSNSADGARPHSSDVPRNATTPIRNIRRRPTRSASRPAGTSSAAKTMLYAFRTQERSARVDSAKSRSMSGNATFTIVTSRKLMKTATAVTPRTCQRRSTIRPSGGY